MGNTTILPGPANVLIVDDEPLIRWSLRRGLTRRGHQVTEAGDGAEALRQLAAQPGRFTVVVLDCRLPDSQDLSLLQDVRRLAPGAAVLMMTAFSDPGMRSDALALGARIVIDKPFQVSAVVSLIESPPPTRPVPDA
jgi:two-component system NtrC family response regulator